MKTTDIVIIVIIGVSCFWAGQEWRDYQTKQRACKALSSFSNVLERELPANHPCAPYL